MSECKTALFARFPERRESTYLAIADLIANPFAINRSVIDEAAFTLWGTAIFSSSLWSNVMKSNSSP